MKILSIIASAELAGAERHVETVARVVPAQHEIVALAPGPMVERWRGTGAAVHVIPAEGKFPVGALPRLAALVRRVAPDVVHAHTPKANLLASLALPRGGPPFVMTVHGSHRQFAAARWMPAGAYLWADRRAARAAAAVVCVCAADRRELAEAGFPAPRLVVVPNGVEDQEGWPVRRDRGRPRVIAWAGRLSAEKRPELAIAVASRLRGHPRLGGFRLVGDGPLRASIVRRCPAVGVRHETGRPGLGSLWTEADILLNTSSSEGMSLGILEAMAAGVPVVATGVGGTPEAVGAGGRIVPPGRDGTVIAELAAAIRVLLEDDEAWEQASRAARERFLAEFGADRMGRRLLALYEGLSRA